MAGRGPHNDGDPRFFGRFTRETCGWTRLTVQPRELTSDSPGADVNPHLNLADEILRLQDLRLVLIYAQRKGGW
jgi:hypothetical protein